MIICKSIVKASQMRYNNTHYRLSSDKRLMLWINEYSVIMEHFVIISTEICLYIRMYLIGKVLGSWTVWKIVYKYNNYTILIWFKYVRLWYIDFSTEDGALTSSATESENIITHITALPYACLTSMRWVVAGGDVTCSLLMSWGCLSLSLHIPRHLFKNPSTPFL